MTNNLKKAKIEQLCRLATDKIENLFSYLQIDCYESNKGFQGCCPVHGGDNHTGWYFYLNPKPKWVCFTHGCDKKLNENGYYKWGSDVVGLIAGVKDISRFEAIEILEAFVNKKLRDIDINEYDAEKENFISNFQTKELNENHTGITRDKIRKRLLIPAEYYLKRQYTHEILDKFDIGTSLKIKNRVIVPQYSNDGYYVGYTARSVFDKCLSCGLYHPSYKMCPQNRSEKQLYCKWLHGKGFNTANWLYNYWNAQKYIKEYRSAILVEGPGDVWRLEEAGIYNSVAMFGTSLKEQQKFILDTSGAMSLIVLTDNDEAGIIASKRIVDECSRSYRLYFPKIDTKDVGELSKDKITSDILPILNKINKICEAI